ncbi:DUF6300 family protein [Iamia majanohamensis]|uniref:DUF6300 family protein n=1 Tax=Iamia majanohamensis TaxID=467976 RepID=A0AAE9Y636_9ACTN|nr:DUF6300 family protein [Iamia majanohamensis]WCO66226.1 DUF6300 family protein [Iamia majanohamensis]
MADELVCPRCRSDDHLSGTRQGEVIRITCSACDLTWDRDPSPRCPACGGEAMVSVPEAVWEKARGTQLSIVSIRVVSLCESCDADRLEVWWLSGTPLPPADNPAEGMR